MHATRADETAAAFDRVAPAYDGPQGNNELIQRMREITWRRIEAMFAPGSRLIDLGCGTGIDAEHFATTGYRVHGTDWSKAMVNRCAARGENPATGARLTAERAGSQDLGALVDRGEHFDGAYSNFGPLNCIDDLSVTSRQLGAMMAPGDRCLFTVIGRVCPWEFVHYLVKRRFERAMVRFAKEQTPVGMAGGTIWTRYYTPKQFARLFDAEFSVVRYEALSLFVPPPYLTWLHDNAWWAFNAGVWLDDHVGAWPPFRNAGDHFMIELRRRE